MTPLHIFGIDAQYIYQKYILLMYFPEAISSGNVYFMKHRSGTATST